MPRSGMIQNRLSFKLFYCYMYAPESKFSTLISAFYMKFNCLTLGELSSRNLTFIYQNV